MSSLNTQIIRSYTIHVLNLAKAIFQITRRRVTSLRRNIPLDLRYGGRFLGGSRRTRFAQCGATDSQNTDYDILAYLFTQVTLTASDVLVDVGSGKGRVLNFWLHMALPNQLVGIELDPILAATLRRRLRNYTTVTVICGDATEVAPADGTMFYLFNPFAAEVLRKFKERLEQACTHSVTVIYYNCLYLHVFERSAGWDIHIIPAPKSTDVKFYDAALCCWRG